MKILAKNSPIAVSALLMPLSALVIAEVSPVLEASAIDEVAAFNCPVSVESSSSSDEVLRVFTSTSAELLGGFSSCPTDVVATEMLVPPVFDEPGVAGVSPSEAMSWSIADVPLVGVGETGV